VRRAGGEPSRAIMVGDSKTDIHTGRAARRDPCARSLRRIGYAGRKGFTAGGIATPSVD